VFWVISVYFNIRNTLLKSGTFLLGHSVYEREEVNVSHDCLTLSLLRGMVKDQCSVNLRQKNNLSDTSLHEFKSSKG
jgi:hypothetical protein